MLEVVLESVAHRNPEQIMAISFRGAFETSDGDLAAPNKASRFESASCVLELP